MNNALIMCIIQSFRYWALFIFLLTVISLGADSTAITDYSFDTTALTKKPFDGSVNVEFYPFLYLYNKTAPLYLLRFGLKNKHYADIYNLKTEGYLQYQRKPFLAFVSGALYGGYFHPNDSLFYDAKFFEGYLKYTPNASLSILMGKRLFQWGKGYAFNPVSFAGRLKDLNNIDASLEGYWNLSFEYVKCFDSPLASLAFTGALLPVYGMFNKGYLPNKTLAGVIQLYLLLLNTDVDFYFFADSKNDVKVGSDISRNLSTNWEVHGEWAFVSNSRSTVFSDESTLVNKSHPANNFIAGTRYLAPFNTTFILEYLHISSGYSLAEMESYYKAINYAYNSLDPLKIQSVLQANSKYFNSQFITTDYIFFKASHPDLFNLVYFTPSIYTIVNILDGSAMAGIEMSYSRLRHLLFTIRYIVFLGSNESEFGSKLMQHRIELRAKLSF